MAPTVSSGSQHESDRASDATLRPQLATNLAQQSPGFSRSIRRGHDIHHQRSQPKLWRRQSSGTHPISNLPDFAPTPNVDSFAPYAPTITLHANIIPLATSPATPGTVGPSLTSSHLPVTEIVLIAVAALIAVIVGLAGMFVMRPLLIRKGSRVLRCCRRQKAKKEVNASENKGVLVNSDEFDDPTWGTPTRFVHVESVSGIIEDDNLRNPGPSLHSSSVLRSLPTWSSQWQRGSPAICDGDSFRDRLHVEENDITLALSVALGDIATQDKEQAATLDPKRAAEESLSFLGHAENVSIFRSLQANIDSLAKGVSSPSITSRPRQGSDASESTSSQETNGRDATDCFSVATSRSSMTSLAFTESDFDEEELEVAYEVKRAHAQSVEIKKGVLVACRRLASTSDDNLIPGTLPTVVVSEPASIQLSLGEQKFWGTTQSLESSLSTTASFGGCNATPSISSLAQENSRGTLGSLSTSFSAATRTEEWCTADEGFLQPSIPYLMVTRPSDSSIYTTDTNSSVSSVSVDLNEFPLPPRPVKPSYYTRLMDQVHGRKRVWDNHPTDSSVSQRRSTVERFIMMYSST